MAVVMVGRVPFLSVVVESQSPNVLGERVLWEFLQPQDERAKGVLGLGTVPDQTLQQALPMHLLDLLKNPWRHVLCGGRPLRR